MKVDRRFVKLLFIYIVLAGSMSYLIVTGMKLLFAEPRPCELIEMCPETYSFPSRHTGVVFSIATIIAVYFRKISYSLVAFLVAGLIGYWRIASGVHTLNDVLGGIVVGVVVGLAVHFFIKKFRESRYRYRPR